jgi:hypothetical protein
MAHENCEECPRNETCEFKDLLKGLECLIDALGSFMEEHKKEPTKSHEEELKRQGEEFKASLLQTLRDDLGLEIDDEEIIINIDPSKFPGIIPDDLSVGISNEALERFGDASDKKLEILGGVSMNEAFFKPTEILEVSEDESRPPHWSNLFESDN